MHKILLTLSVLTVLAALCCDDDDNQPQPQPTVSFEDIDIVTGVALRDENGNPLGYWMSPNHKPGGSIVFPNPSNGQVAFYSLDSYDDLWLLPAECLIDTDNEDITLLSADLTYTVEQIDSLHIRKTTFINSQNQILLDYSDIPAGFYRLFYTDAVGEVFWHNLFIDPSLSGFPSIEILDDFCE